MAKTIKIKYDVDTGEAVTDTENLTDATEELGKTSKDTAKDLEGIGEGAKKSSKGVKKIGTSIGGLVKAAGIIGLMSLAFDVLKEAFSGNQKVMDAFNTATTALKIVFNDLFSFISDNIGPITTYFKKIFDDPQKALKDFGAAIKANIIERFNSALDTLGFLATAIKKVFEGDFEGAMESAKNAGKEFTDVMTGVDGSFDKIVDGSKDLIKSVTEYATETLKAADAIVQQEKAMVSLENQQVRIREAADRDAELQRQIRDDVTKGINDRIQANKDLGVVLEQQLKDEKKNIQSRISAIRAENDGLGLTQEKLDEIYALETELIAVEAANAGFKSEQQINTNALLQEQVDAKRELQKIGLTDMELEILAAEQEAELRRQQVDLFVETEEEKLEFEKSILDDLNAKKDDIAAADKLRLENEVKAKEAADDAITASDKKKAKEEKAEKLQAVNDSFNAASATLDIITLFAGENEKLKKGLAITQVTIDTAQAIIGTWAGYASGNIPGAILAVAQTAAIVANSAIQINNIKSASKSSTVTKPQRTTLPSTSDSSTSQSGADAAPVPAVDNLAGFGLIQEAPRAWVLESDVSSNLEANRRLERRAILG
jgi:hypothetical protein